MTPEQIGALFTRKDGSYLCARWGRPIVPVVFGVEEATLPVVKGAIEAVVAHAGHRMAETDPELGANLLVFFLRDWAELPAVPNLERLVPDLAALCARLEAAGANQYRTFRQDAAGAIKAAVVFLRMDRHLAELPAETLALAQAAQVMLTWSDQAFVATGLLAARSGAEVLHPDIAAVLRAAYDPVLPGAARDPSHALRLAARLPRGGA